MRIFMRLKWGFQPPKYFQKGCATTAANNLKVINKKGGMSPLFFINKNKLATTRGSATSVALHTSTIANQCVVPALPTRIALVALHLCLSSAVHLHD